MYTMEQRELLERFDRLAEELGSQNRASQLIGVSSSVISPLKKEEYRGDAEKQFSKLRAYFGTKEEAAARPSAVAFSGEYAPTGISEHVYRIIRNCQLQGGLAVACGDAGIGKTMAAKKFLRDHPLDSLAITANPCFRGVKPVLKQLSNRLGVSERTNDELWLGIAAKLRDGMVIIIDEAQHLPVKTLEVLRAFADEFSERGQTLGVALVGNIETINAFGGRKRAEFAQISNRTRQKKVYTTGDIREEDIRIVFPAVTAGSSEAGLLLAVARSPQAIRGAVNLYRNALDNADTSYEGLIAMAKAMEVQL